MNAFNRLAIVSLLGLIVLGVVWEAWLAPLRPEGSWLILKVLPLMAGVFGILRGRRYTHQWMSMLVLLYFLEGSIRVLEENPVRLLAGIEIALAMGLFIGCLGYAKLSAPSRQKTTAKKS
jgi:uncharacterized membrane protein